LHRHAPNYASRAPAAPFEKEGLYNPRQFSFVRSTKWIPPVEYRFPSGTSLDFGGFWPYALIAVSVAGLLYRAMTVR
jgi:hypothetical protein